MVAVSHLRVLTRPRNFRLEPAFVNEGHLHGWDHAHFRNLAERHCGLRLVALGHDHVRLPLLSPLATRLGGHALAIRLETGFFLKIAPYHSNSIIALLEAGNDR